MTTASEAVSKLVRAGAAMVVQPGGVPMPVGLMREIGPGRWFWWEAGCENEFGGHVLVGRPAVLYDGLAVRWEGADGYGYLTTIEECSDEPDERARLWNLLAVWRRAYESRENLRGFIERQVNRRSGEKA